MPRQNRSLPLDTQRIPNWKRATWRHIHTHPVLIRTRADIIIICSGVGDEHSKTGILPEHSKARFRRLLYITYHQVHGHREHDSPTRTRKLWVMLRSQAKTAPWPHLILWLRLYSLETSRRLDYALCSLVIQPKKHDRREPTTRE